MPLTVRELDPNEYALWDKLIATSPQRCIFAERWWIDIVTQGTGRLLACFDGERLLAGLPIWPCVMLGVRRLRQPPLTPYWGPILQPLEGKYQTRLNTEMGILRAFARALAPWPDVFMQFHPTLTNWLPFYWTGFSQSTGYTYMLDHLQEREISERLLQDNARSRLRQARKQGLATADNVDPAIVGEMFRRSLARQGLKGSRGILDLWPRLAQAAQEHNCLFTTAAVDGEGNVHFARALVWDERYAYGILGGGDPRFRHTAGGTLTQWRRIQYAATVAPAYDFEGSILEPLEQFFRGFGGELCPYLFVTRASSLRLNAARALQRGLAQGRQWTDRLRGGKHKNTGAGTPTPVSLL